MALFSLSASQLLLAFFSAVILHKLTSHNFFLRWLTCKKLAYIKPPLDNELYQLGESQSGKKKSGKRSKREPTKQHNDGIFKVALKDLGNLKLTESYLKLEDLISINYGTEVEWVIGLAIMSAISYSITEFQFFIFPKTEDFNFSLLWALLVILSSAKLLWALTAFYFKYDESLGERTLCIAVGCAFLLIAMIVLIVDESKLEFGLNDTYKAFSTPSQINSITKQTTQTRYQAKEVSIIMVKLVIAIVSAFFGVMFTFPGIRFGQIQRAILDDPTTSKITSLLIVTNYLAPLLVVLLWVKPLLKDLILQQEYITITNSTFDTFRIYYIVSVSLLKVALLPLYTGTFLRSAAQRIVRLTRRPGHATNRDIRNLMAGIPQYIHAVIIQYTMPTILCLFTAILFKTIAGQRWIPSHMMRGSLSTSVVSSNTTISHENEDSFEPTISQTITLLNMIPLPAQAIITEFKAMFSPKVLRGLLGYATWWLHFAWFCASSLGVAYHAYFV